MVWRIIFYATGLTPPGSIRHMFGSWLSNQSSKVMIWVGVAAICWAIWRCRNDIIFHKIKLNSILQVIFRGTYWLRFWAQLQHSEQAKDAISLIKNLETLPWKWSKEDGKISIVCFSFPYVSETLAWSLSLVLNSSCNNGLCMHSCIEAGFCIRYLKKMSFTALFVIA
jgi:hypothetical protein